ncbi:MAG: hypothetical protein CMH46_05605 [Muricauda sp.]|nr:MULTISPECIES: hypothetical protein [unclassified Allomuricauda]MAU14999.1 hypothetical protein [Allomuricauda sp.]
MKKKVKNLLYCSTFFLIFGCGSDDGVGQENGDDNQVSGTITLSGAETSELGTSLTVGNIEVANASLTGTDKSVILMSENISVVDNEFVYDDDQNGFVIVAADFSTGGSTDIDSSISMTIVKDGVEYRHACSSPYLNFFTACGDGFGIDFDAKSVTFDGTTVINTEDDTILTMDGTITWD